MSSSSATCSELPKKSPVPPNKKLQRSVHNQTSPGSKNNRCLRLRQINLRDSRTLIDIISQCGAHASQITHLDISYSVTDSSTLKTFCSHLTQLQVLIAVECGLLSIDEDTPWPTSLQTINFSRNQLSSLPSNFFELFELTELNLSGNIITELNPSLLSLSKLQKIHLLNNPIKNAPKSVCREGVKKLRQFFNVVPRPAPMDALARKTLDLRRLVLHNRGSIDSGYESRQRTSSSYSSTSSFSDVDSIDSLEEWPVFREDNIPDGYTKAMKLSDLCQVYLPEGSDFKISIKIVKDLSFHPKTSFNNLIVSPVIRISPHGVQFTHDKPAIIVLNHCTKPTDSSQQLKVIPLCSDTKPTELPHWTELTTSDSPQIFNDCVMFTTTHFSMFTVIASTTFPSKSIIVSPNAYNLFEMQEIEGFKMEIPPKCVLSPIEVSTTVYYTDSNYTPASPEHSPATACIGVEPHCVQFHHPVKVSIPLPHYNEIKQLLPNATIKLYHAPHHNTYNGKLKWELAENKQYEIVTENGMTIVSFETTHFSLFDFVWNIGQGTLNKFGLGASYVYKHLTQTGHAATLTVQWQAFMTPPLRDLSFGLALCVYKFGEPLKELSNFPWLVGEGKELLLRIGELKVSLHGHFKANKDVNESLDRVFNFSGEDFSVRFDFALKLSEQLSLPLENGQFLGKLKIAQANGKTANYNLHKVRKIFIQLYISLLKFFLQPFLTDTVLPRSHHGFLTGNKSNYFNYKLL